MKQANYFNNHTLDTSVSSDLNAKKIKKLENLIKENINSLEQDNDKEFKKILIIYTGGTIGMMKGPNGYIPKKHFLADYIYNHPNLCDKKFTNEKLEELDSTLSMKEHNTSPYNKKKITNLGCSQKSNRFVQDQPFVYKHSLNNVINKKSEKFESKEIKKLCSDLKSNIAYSQPTQSYFTPLNQFNKRIEFELIEFNEVIDSSNVNLYYWNLIAESIFDMYDKYDGFVILHGTDTMSYTASALSFMFENLNKPIIITGSQIPLIEMSNDGLANLIDSINLCGTFHIPEVCILFRGKLLRGNRSIKNDNRGLNAFESPNIESLIEIGTKYKVKWNIILLPPLPNAQISLTKLKDKKVIILKYFPTMGDDTIQNIFNQNGIEGIIIETYGSGNLPSNRESLVNCLLKLSSTDIVIVNISQCRKGIMSADYEVGKQLEKLGLIYGSDMTVECALSKLNYLLSKGYSKKQIKDLFSQNMRGELTENKTELFSFSSNYLINSIREIFEKGTSINTDEVIINEFLPSFIIDLVRKDQLSVLHSLKYHINKMSNKLINEMYPSYTKTPLHFSCEQGNIELTNYLINIGFKLNVIDNLNKTPLYYACLSKNQDLCEYLFSKGAQKSYQELEGDFLCKLAFNNDLETLKLLFKYYSNEILITNYEKRNIVHIASIRKNKSIILFLKDNINYPIDILVDEYEKSAYDYANEEIRLILRPNK